jgi:competence protein ComGC
MWFWKKKLPTPPKLEQFDYKGVTLVELLVVVAFVGILFALLIPVINVGWQAVVDNQQPPPKPTVTDGS